MPAIIVTTCSTAAAAAVCGVVLLSRLDAQTEIMAAHVALLVVMTMLLMTASSFVQLPRHPGSPKTAKPKHKHTRSLQAFPRYSADQCDDPAAAARGSKDYGLRLTRSCSLNTPRSSTPLYGNGNGSSSCTADDTARLLAHTRLAHQHRLDEATLLMEAYLWDSHLLALDIQRASQLASTAKALDNSCALTSARSSRSQQHFDVPL